MKPEALRADPWAFGPWCFVIDEVRTFETPIPARGMQGWWPLRGAGRLGLQTLCNDLAGAEVRAGWTLLQPYASAVAVGPKRIENRPQRKGIPPQGVWLGLHAGSSPYDMGQDYIREWRIRGLWADGPDLGAMPRGVMLGVLHVVDCLRYPGPGSGSGGQLAFELERDEPSEGK